MNYSNFILYVKEIMDGILFIDYRSLSTGANLGPRMPVLTTARLTIRPFIMEDLAEIHRILDLEAMMEPQPLEERRAWLEWNVRNTTEHANLPLRRVMERLGMRVETNPLPEPAWFQVVGILERRAV